MPRKWARSPRTSSRNKDGEVETVYYDKVNAILLNAVKVIREKQALSDIVRDLQSSLDAFEDRAKLG